MAPKRKSSNRNDNDSVAAVATRVTRSSTRLANAAVTPPAADPKPPKGKKAKTTKTAAAAGKVEAELVSEPDCSKTIIIERCTQCTQFKKRAILVKEGLEKEVEGVNVVVNPEKPRRGCFEIREKGGEIFISLLNMKRPFGPMKALDMEKVIADIVEKIR